MTLGLLLWGAVALLTAIRGPVGGTALILVFATPTTVALVLGDLLLILLALPVLVLVITPGAKEQILPYYRRRKGDA